MWGEDARSVTEGPALSVRGFFLRVASFELPSAGYPASARWHVFQSPVFLPGVGAVVRTPAVEDVWDGRSPSLRGRSWARYVTEGPALSVRGGCGGRVAGFFFPVSALSIGRAPWGCLGRTEPIPPRMIAGAWRHGGSGSVGPGLSAGGSRSRRHWILLGCT